MRRTPSLRERIISAITSVVLCTFLASSLSLIADDGLGVRVRQAVSPGTFYGEPAPTSVTASKWSAKMIAKGGTGGNQSATVSEAGEGAESIEGASACLLVNAIALVGIIIVTLTCIALVGSAVVSIQSRKRKIACEKLLYARSSAGSDESLCSQDR